PLLVMGDFNCRIGSYQNDTLVHVEAERNSFDLVTNTRGKKLIEFLTLNNFCVLNGSSVSDEGGNFTFISHQGCSVVDYAVVTHEFSATFMHDFEVLSSPLSDHMPIQVSLFTQDIQTEESRRLLFHVSDTA